MSLQMLMSKLVADCSSCAISFTLTNPRITQPVIMATVSTFSCDKFLFLQASPIKEAVSEENNTSLKYEGITFNLCQACSVVMFMGSTFYDRSIRHGGGAPALKSPGGLIGSPRCCQTVAQPPKVKSKRLRGRIFGVFPHRAIIDHLLGYARVPRNVFKRLHLFSTFQARYHLSKRTTRCVLNHTAQICLLKLSNLCFILARQARDFR